MESTPVLKDSHGKKKVAAVLSMGCVEDMLAEPFPIGIKIFRSALFEKLHFENWTFQ